jgi:hypothetical protein
MTEEKYRFDLSDGFGKEDIRAILNKIWHAIIFVLKLIFYPYVWLFRMFGRSIRFVRTKKSPEKALGADERSFIESIPGFFVLVGFFGGILFALIIWITDETGLGEFLENLNITEIADWFEWFLTGTAEVILTIIGIDDRTVTPTRDRWGLLDFIFDFLYGDILKPLVTIISNDPVTTFIGIGIIGVAIAIAWIIISETGIVIKVISMTTSVASTAVGVPSKAWNKSYVFYKRFNQILASIVIGQARLDGRNIGFHRKILLLTLGLGIYTFFSGIVVGASSDQTSFDPILFTFIVILVLGVGVGIIEMFLIVRILDLVSREKYIVTSNE